MYYYLLYNSSFPFIVENRLFSTILYGSILYILTHAILNYCDVSILSIINNYFWTTLTLDVISFTYAIYNSFMNNEYGNGSGNSNGSGSDNGSDNGNNLNVSFNLLKNKINTMLDRKNDLTITHIPPTKPYQNNTIKMTKISKMPNKNQLQENFNNINDLDFSDLDNIVNSQTSSTKEPSYERSQFSTPIKNLQNNKPKLTQASTPINLIRSTNKIEEPIIQDEIIYSNIGNGPSNESIAGSDVGSVMDLEDFENSF